MSQSHNVGTGVGTAQWHSASTMAAVGELSSPELFFILDNWQLFWYPFQPHVTVETHTQKP